MSKANEITTTTGTATTSTKGWGSVFKNSWSTTKVEKNNIPFLPDDWKKKIPRLARKGLKSKWRDKDFEYLAKAKQSTLKRHLHEKLESMGYEPVSADGYVYAKGEIPIMLVAHMDTVHLRLPKYIIYSDKYVMSPEGIGGDDRCGIYMVLKVLEQMKCSVVFTEEEETGCVGASKFSKSPIAKQIAEDKSINYIVEFDRRGKNDAVFYDCDNSKFTDFVESTGFFEYNWGSCSDISIIAPALGVAAVNLSCGYYQAHTVDEYVNLEEMHKVIDEAIKLMQKHDERYEYIEKVYRYYKNYKSYSYDSTARKGWYDEYDEYDDWKELEEEYYRTQARLSDREDKEYLGRDDVAFSDGKWTDIHGNPIGESDESNDDSYVVSHPVSETQHTYYIEFEDIYGGTGVVFDYVEAHDIYEAIENICDWYGVGDEEIYSIKAIK